LQAADTTRTLPKVVSTQRTSGALKETSCTRIGAGMKASATLKNKD
jgi:hypothetical protein